MAFLLLWLVAPAPVQTGARGTATHTFGWKGEHFLLDGKPFQIHSGEMHYMRVPREYWRDRLKKMRAMGLNTVCTYAFWNGHEPEPGKFDFGGNNDIAGFIRTAQEEGLWVIVRPGPYGCAEWEWGGYPYWLARIPGLKVRSMDPRFVEACRRYMTALGRQLAPLQVTRGGPLIMVQVENEYGSYGNDKVYLRTIKDMITAAGIDLTLYTSDGYSDSMLQGGTLPEILSVVNFGDEPDKAFAQLAHVQREGLMPRSCRRLLTLALTAGSVVWTGGLAARAQQQTAFTFDRYHSPQEISAALAAIVKANPAATALHRIAVSAGGTELAVLEVGPEKGKKLRKVPAVLVLANMEGTIPISTEAALHLADLILRKGAARDLTWFILPNGNPDGAARFFRKPLLADGRNARKVNDDSDDQADEDGPEDLNGDGIITQIRVKDPAGEWIAVEADPRLMRRADPAKGEKGVYRLYTEGIDNDGDGEYNEDGPGGVNVGITFPHLFKPFTPTAGLWPGSEEETLGILRFVFDHPEIAMTMTLGATDMCLVPPAGGRQGSADLTQVKVPERIATQIGLDPNRTYTIQEIVEIVRPLAPPGFEITESVVAGFLGLGAVVNPLEDDLKVYRELSDRYKEFLRTARLDAKRLEPTQPADASPELWSYYHLGVPTFSMDFWTLPEVAEEKTEKSGITADTLEAMTSEAFVALGETKIDAFLKEVGAPPNIRATMLVEGVKGGKMTPKQMAGMVRQMPKPAATSGGDPKMKALVAFSDKELGGGGFVAWTPFKHPQLGDVEIGGPVPFADTTPPASMLKTLLDGQVPWVLTLSEKLPRMKILKTEVNPKGAGIHEVNVWVENSGALSFPTAMGKRNQQVPPVVVTLKAAGLTLLSGRMRMPIKDIDAKKSVKLTWLVQAAGPTMVDILLESANAGNDAAQIRLGGAQ